MGRQLIIRDLLYASVVGDDCVAATTIPEVEEHVSPLKLPPDFIEPLDRDRWNRRQQFALICGLERRTRGVHARPVLI